MSKRFGKKRVPSCTCTYRFTCRACLVAGLLIVPALHGKLALIWAVLSFFIGLIIGYDIGDSSFMRLVW